MLSPPTHPQNPQASVSLLHLAADPVQRERLEREPAVVLAECGIELSELPEQVKLPSIAEIREYLADPGNGNGKGPPNDGKQKDLLWVLFLG